MATVAAPSAMGDTMAELLDQLGGMPAYRVLLQPTPGTATEQDVIAIRRSERSTLRVGRWRPGGEDDGGSRNPPTPSCSDIT